LTGGSRNRKTSETAIASEVFCLCSRNLVDDDRAVLLELDDDVVVESWVLEDQPLAADASILANELVAAARKAEANFYRAACVRMDEEYLVLARRQALESTASFVEGECVRNFSINSFDRSLLSHDHRRHAQGTGSRKQGGSESSHDVNS
jgi:hypothetical protein